MAIAFDAKSKGNAAATNTITVAHTCTGSNLILIVNAISREDVTGSTFTGITYNGVALTQLSTQTQSTAWIQDVWYLINPSTGANNIIASLSAASTDGIVISAASYTGVKQTSPFTTAGQDSNTSASSLSASTTTSVDNSWVVCAVMFNGTISPTPLGSEVIRDVDASGATFGGLEDIVDVVAGAQSMGWEAIADTGRFMVTTVGFEPVAAAAAASHPLLMRV